MKTAFSKTFLAISLLSLTSCGMSRPTTSVPGGVSSSSESVTIPSSATSADETVESTSEETVVSTSEPIKTPEGSTSSFESVELSSVEEPSSSEESEAVSSEEASSESASISSSSESSSSSAPIDPSQIRSVSFTDTGNYSVGDIYDTANVVVKAKLKNGKTVELSGYQIKVSGGLINGPSGEELAPTDRFTVAGTYSLTIWLKYQGEIYGDTIFFKVASGFDSEGYELTSVDYVGGIGFSLGHIVANELRELPLLLHWNNGDEYYTYRSETDDKGISFSVKKQGDESTEYLNVPLEANTTYRLILSYGGFSGSKEFKVYGNYYKLDREDLTFTTRDFLDGYSNCQGDVMMLVIPITLQGDYVDQWTSAKLKTIKDCYFGDDPDKVSMKSYYANASFGQMNIAGTVTSPYVESDASLTSMNIQNDDSREKLNQLIANAVEYVRAHSGLNLDDYDTDDDGCLDNVHLIVNFNTTTYQNQAHTSAWGTPLWPHQSVLYASGTKEEPAVNGFSLTTIDSVKDAITAIHEQGHVFGLDDYYDYSRLVDYVGGADMQSYNIFDWNPFSKLSVGWSSPYVVTGPTELTIGAASLNGDFIIVPADPSTFNNSAYDEYFMIELFSQYGNNAVNYPVRGVYQGSSWDYWERSKGVDLGEFGVRLYHVDARMQWWDGTNHVYHEATAKDKGKWLYLPIDNSYYNGYEVEDALKPFADCKLLSIIQQGGTDTFGDIYGRQYLEGEDLFHEGDVFTFNRYKHFLSKSGRAVKSMDNGETFPYKITFTSMSSTRATVKIELA